MKRKKFNRGFTLVETLVALGILGVASVGFMKYIETSNRAQRSIEAKNSLASQDQYLSGLIANKNACQLTLEKISGLNENNFSTMATGKFFA